MLDRFFDGHTALRAEVGAAADEEVVNHLGFQIREPLDVWMEGLARWTPRLEVVVVGTKRFTSSATFQAHVGAFAEMAQIWLEFDGQVVELELFDIHREFRPNGGVRSGSSGRNTRQLLDECGSGDLFALVGRRRHLALRHPRGVRWRRGAATRAVSQPWQTADPNYRLRSNEVVANVARLDAHEAGQCRRWLEIEFLSYRVDWPD